MPITAIRAEPIFGKVHRDLAIVSSLTFLTPDGGHMKGNYVLVRISDDAGRVGLGEASVTSVWSGETQAGTIALIEQELAPALIGADPFDIEWISPPHGSPASTPTASPRAPSRWRCSTCKDRSLGVPVYQAAWRPSSPMARTRHPSQVRGRRRRAGAGGGAGAAHGASVAGRRSR